MGTRHDVNEWATGERSPAPPSEHPTRAHAEKEEKRAACQVGHDEGVKIDKVEGKRRREPGVGLVTKRDVNLFVSGHGGMECVSRDQAGNGRIASVDV